MAADILSEQVINGFSCVTRMDIINNSDVVMEYIGKMRGLFASIELLGHECGELASGEIVALAGIGRGFADLAHNDEDVLRERAEKAGVIQSLATEEVTA